MQAAVEVARMRTTKTDAGENAALWCCILGQFDCCLMFAGVEESGRNKERHSVFVLVRHACVTCLKREFGTCFREMLRVDLWTMLGVS